MESKRTSTTYFIPPGKFLLMENALGNPDLIQSSVSSDCRVTIVDTANFPLDELEQWPTFRLTSSDVKLKLGEGLYYVYIVVPTPDNTDTSTAFISYNTVQVDRKGYDADGKLLGKEKFCYYQCGTVSARGGHPSATTTPSGQGRLIEVDLGVTPAPSTLPGGLNDFDYIFQLDKVDPNNPKSWLLTILATVREMTARLVRITGSLVFGSGESEKMVTDVALSAQSADAESVSDTILPTTAWVYSRFLVLDDRFLRKDQDDYTPHSLSVGKDLSVQGTVSSGMGFEAGKFTLGATGVGVYQNDDGQWVIETDNLNVRRKFSANEVEIQTTNHIGGQTLLSAASMVVERVEEIDGRYRCFFRKKDSEGNIVRNQWKVGDQAFCNTFNLEKQADGTIGNHYYWREVVGVSADSYSEVWHYVDMSISECASGSSIPKSGDKVVHLGYSKSDDANRQNAIIIAGAGVGSPYIQLFVGINSFSLPEPEQLKPGDNRLSGRLTIKEGSSGWQNLSGLNNKFNEVSTEIDQVKKDAEDAASEVAKKESELAEERANAYADGIVTEEESKRIEQAEKNLQAAKDYADEKNKELDDKMNNLEYGKNNLLRNSGFTGDYVTASLKGESALKDNSEMFSPSLKYWSSSLATAMDVTESESGKGVQIQGGGFIQQSLFYSVMEGEHYVFSFRAKGAGSVTLEVNGYTHTFALTSNTEFVSYVDKFVAVRSGRIFKMSVSGSCVICEPQLERGTLKSAWGMSPMDNRSEIAKYDSLSYITSAIENGSSDFLGGLGLMNLLFMKDLNSKVTAGVSGLCDDDSSVAYFAGGDLEKAINTAMTYVENPEYEASENEIRNMAKFVVTHGGRAILNDVILHGYIYALGGKFRGAVEALSGMFTNISTPNGSFGIDGKGTVRLGGFRVKDNGISNQSGEGSYDSNAYIFLRNVENNTLAAIGGNVAASSTGQTLLAKFTNTDNKMEQMSSLSNECIEVSAKGADENVALSIDGGCVKGLAYKTFSITDSDDVSIVIPIEVVSVSCIASETKVVSLPTLRTCDDGHVVRIVNMGVRMGLYPRPCYTYNLFEEELTNTLIFYKGTYYTSTGLTLEPNDVIELVFHRQISKTIDNTKYRGIWIAK